MLDNKITVVRHLTPNYPTQTFINAILQEIIMAQLRKFEQDAIASEILDTIKSKLKVQQEELTNSKEYKALVKLVENMNGLEQERKMLSEQITELNRRIQDEVSEFNHGICYLQDFNVHYTGSYNSNAGIAFQTNDWNIRNTVDQKLAIALLSPDWKDTLPQIIEDIANHFTR